LGFKNGFEKIAVSSKGVFKVVANHRKWLETGSPFDAETGAKLRNNYKDFKKAIQAGKEIFPEGRAGKTYERKMLKNYIGEYRNITRTQSAKEINKIKNASPGLKQTATVKTVAKKTKLPYLAGGIGLAGAGLAAYKYFKNKKNPTPTAQVDNNYLPSEDYLKGVPSYALLHPA